MLQFATLGGLKQRLLKVCHLFLAPGLKVTIFAKEDSYNLLEMWQVDEK